MTQQKYVVRVVRPVFQAAYLEVEGRSESEACSQAFQSAYTLPEESWRGRFNPEDYFFDIHCVHDSETREGNAFSLLDFPLYSILSTNGAPYIRTDGHQPWMNYASPLSLSAQVSEWISQLEETRRGQYEEGIEEIEQSLREWRGTDQKVVPLVPPEDRRERIEYLEVMLKMVQLLNDVD